VVSVAELLRWAIGVHVQLATLPVEAVVEKALGEIQVEIAVQGLAQPFHAHAVVEQAVEDGLADAVGVLGAGFDSCHLRAEGLAASTAGAVFSDLDVEDADLAVSDVANAARVRLLAVPQLATRGARESLRGAVAMYHADAGLNSVHACVPPGLEVSLPGRHRLVF